MGWLSEWADYFGKNIRRLFLSLWDSLKACSILAFLSSATFSALYLYFSHGEPFSPEAWGVLGALSAMFGLMALVGISLAFFVVFATFFALSLHGKGRKLADRIFKFAKPTKLEALEERVGKIEDELPEVNRRLGNIESRLGNIEATLEKMAKGTNQAKHQPS
jgi:MFS family permease